MKSIIKAITTVTFALGILGTSAFASGGRGTSIEFRPATSMKMSKSSEMTDARTHSKQVVIKLGHLNR